MTPEQLELNRAVARAKGWNPDAKGWDGPDGHKHLAAPNGDYVCFECPFEYNANWAGSQQAYELLEEARLNLDWGGAALPDSGWVYAPDESPFTSSTVQFVHVFKTPDELYLAICRAWLAWHRAKEGGE